VVRIGIVDECTTGEKHVTATPATVIQLLKLGYDTALERGAGEPAGFADMAYSYAGAAAVSRDDAWSSKIVSKVIAPTDDEIARLHDGVTIVSLISPAFDPELVAELADRPIPALAMDAVPRISRAQSMDALSSMANIAGYRAVVVAAHKFGRFFTGQVTAAGRFPPAKVPIAGAGVAAIGAASSLGAIVRTTDPE
jgi:NAD(P) transhydrogenase subunit alpha